MPKRAGNLTDKVDRHLLHLFLWKYKDRSDFMTFRSGELAELLGITVYSMSTILGEMVERGYLKKVSSKYQVIDPGITAWIPSIPPAKPEVKQDGMF